MQIKIATTFWQRMRGLLFRPLAWLSTDEALVIVPCSSIHTFGMRRAIDVAFVSSDGRVIESRQNVDPGLLLSRRGSVAVLERFSISGEADALLRSPWYQVGDAVSIGTDQKGEALGHVSMA